jgi:hypothetical protein
MQFLPPETGNLDEIRGYLAANLENAQGASGSDRKKSWIKSQLKICQYERLNREDKGAVRQFLQKASGYSRAQIAREISLYRQELLGAGQAGNVTAGPVPAISKGSQSAPIPVKFEVSPTEQGTTVEVRVNHEVMAESGQPFDSATGGLDRRGSAQGKRLTDSTQHPATNPGPQPSLWRRIRRFVLISSLIVNIAFIAMLLSMSLLEQARKSATQAAESIHEIQPGDSSLHAAPSEAPMP